MIDRVKAKKALQNIEIEELSKQIGELKKAVMSQEKYITDLEKDCALYRTISELISDYSYVLHLAPNGWLIREWVSDAFVSITGYTPEELDDIGGWVELVYPEDREEVIRHRNIFKSGKEDVSEYRIITKDGRICWLRDYARPIVGNRENHRLRIVGAAQDITRQKNAEEKERTAYANISALIENSEDYMMIADEDGCPILFNSAYEKMVQKIFGVAMKPGIKPYKYLKNEEAITWWESVHKQALSGEAFREEYLHRLTNGEIKYFEVYLNPVKKENQVIGFSEISRDITERKVAEEKLKAGLVNLEAKNASKDKFFSIIAHDLKNPFTSILYGIELARNELKGEDNQNLKDTVDEIYNSAESLYKLTENLLTWSQIHQDKIHYHPDSIELYYMVMYNFQILQARADQKEISLKCSIEKNLFVYADYQMLDIVIRNLLSNAVKFTKPHGRVEVLAKELDYFVEVSVVDTGIGMTEKQVKKIFKIDEKNKSTCGTDGERGTGLGLVLCKEFIEKNRGQIWVISKDKMGSTFKFTLPKPKGEMKNE